MQIWNDLDEKSQSFIKYGLLIILLLLAILGFWRSKVYKNELNTPMVINRFPVKEVKLIEAYKKNGDFYMSLIDMKTAKRYEDVFLSTNCPHFKNKPGQKMYVMIIQKIKPVTQETFLEFERVYDYICTNKNMEEIDKKLEVELAKSLKEGAVYKSPPVNLTPEEEKERLKMLNRTEPLIK